MTGMDDAFHRLALITGSAVLERLAALRVLVVGLGGVGSWCAEALCRSGVASGGGVLTLADCDTVCVTNINRQLEATAATVGEGKAAVLASRLREIVPACRAEPLHKMFSRATAGEFDIPSYDYVIDAIDTLICKLDLIECCAASKVALFSSMGMARRLDPTRVKTASIWETRGCPLARSVRQGLTKRCFDGDFIAVYSDEPPLPRHDEIAAVNDGNSYHTTANGSAVPVTAAAGMTLASLVLRDVMRRVNREPQL